MHCNCISEARDRYDPFIDYRDSHMPTTGAVEGPFYRAGCWHVRIAIVDERVVAIACFRDAVAVHAVAILVLNSV